jgi:hypothetical protein
VKPTIASTAESTDLSPLPAFSCNLLQSRTAAVAARFSLLPPAAGVPPGLLIPRSQVRSLPGPSDHQASLMPFLGESRVSLICETSTGPLLYDLPTYKVRPVPDLFAEAKALFGEAGVV